MGVTSPAKNKEILNKMQNTCLEKYGYRNPFEVEEFKEKSNNTRLRKYGHMYTLQDPKRVQNMKLFFKTKGKWYNYEDYTDKQYYYAMVELEQRKYNKELQLLPNFCKRGRLDLNPAAFHIDHKYSKISGFECCILPYYIGHICNLEMTPGSINLTKGRKCNISLNTLVNNILGYRDNESL